ncbi:metallophosphoesterase [Actinophytocola sp.]|uniref:metallophosphoesterase n=1 Tax=Actinophytocola sp. TaxID=1872138 RepID=UPI003899FC4C
MARPRPQDMSEAQLGFRPRKAVRWLGPKVLITTGAQSLVAEIFGSYADKRELQGSLPAVIHDHGGHDELWFDYVADLGDGFDATYSVASLLAAPSLDLGTVAPPGLETATPPRLGTAARPSHETATPPGLETATPPRLDTAARPGHETATPRGQETTTPRGRLLIMGGDQVYPAASTSRYEDRTKGVYRAALPVAPPQPPTLLALPGNHDWYDGLTSFLRVFAQRRPFGGWQTEQTRSYFAVRLPQRWWLYAIDTQFDDYLDAPQLEYFRTASADLQDGDAVILCTSTPDWVPAGAGGATKGYDTVEFFQREIIRPRGASVRLMLSGDTHHYARYAEQAGTSQLITCGLGGAYLAATDHLPVELTLPPHRSRVREPAQATRFELKTRYPRHTGRLAAGIFRLPWRNLGFWGLTGATQLLTTMAMLYGLTESAVRSGVFGLLTSWSPAVIVAGVLVLAGVAFARLELPGAARRHVIAGAMHAVGHLALSVGWALAIRWLYHDVLPHGAVGDWLVFLVAAVGTPVLIGFVDAEVVALYLLVASRRGINLNELMAGQSVEDHKGFLRMHIADDGTLTIYPVKLDRICRTWRPNPDGAATDPWFLPERPLTPELIEPPIRIPRTP